MLVRGDGVYVLQYTAGTEFGFSSNPNRLSKLSIADGQVRWSRDGANLVLVARPQALAGEIALTAAGDALVLAHSWVNRLRLERVDTASGALLREDSLSCGQVCGPLMASQLSTDGTLRLAATQVSPAAGQTALVLALPGMDRDPPPTRADQPGVSGLWYSPYANGEGLAIDWLPGSRTLFAAWFTYVTGSYVTSGYINTSGNDPAGQRWYSLQADGVAAGARALDLPILRTERGNFGAEPAVAPRRVGSAKLQFIDCNKAYLTYTFDGRENEGAQGSITLNRLTPATQPCILADGSSVPGAGARPPARGFDAKLSGAWYDEAIPGQGLQLNIQPDGVFFAPWFAYDPADQQPGNDPYRQHWFTLQGDLSQAVNGRVEALLVQTVGGLFDRVPTSNAQIIGSATLTVQGCDKARLDYRFNSHEGAGSFAARSGSMNLSRIGGCAP